jgi:hypothetical protein
VSHTGGGFNRCVSHTGRAGVGAQGGVVSEGIHGSGAVGAIEAPRTAEVRRPEV